MEKVGYINNSDGQSPEELDKIFAALADPTRRTILARLSKGDASVGELAEPFEMSQPAISKHLKVLGKAGLVERIVDKQKRLARLKAGPMTAAISWLEQFREFWGANFEQLDELLNEMKQAKTPTKSRGKRP